jgi:hypothetical protein
MPKDGEAHPESKTTTQEPVKYELNGKTFQSAEEMSKYVADLEQKVIQAPTVQSQVQQPVQNQKVIIDGLTLDQLMFANPERYHQYVTEQANRQVDLKLAQAENKRNFWNNFYATNPDLRGKEEIVDMLVQKNWTEWEKKPVSEFAKVVADSSRSTLKKIGANATEVRSSEAAALSASGQGAPQIEVAKKATSFVDEMNERRIKRQAKKA